MPCHRATVEKKNGVIKLGELEYQKKWYMPIYFRNSVLLLKSSKKGGIGPFWSHLYLKLGIGFGIWTTIKSDQCGLWDFYRIRALGHFLKLGLTLNNGSHFRSWAQAFRLQPKPKFSFRLPFLSRLPFALSGNCQKSASEVNYLPSKR